ncbi:hypothetical protein [Roseibium marinum]|nr:hypothetical protein [Roseibium marinum]
MVYRRAKRNVYLTAAAGVCFATAYVAGLAAVWAFLAPLWGPAEAAALIAAVMAGVGVVIIAVLSFVKFRERRRNSRRRAAMRLSAAAAVSILPRLTKSRSLLVIAALGGLAFLATQGGDQE